MPRALPRPLISAISDRHRLAPRDDESCAHLVSWAALAARAGVGIIQIRERGLTDSMLVALMRQVVAATTGTAALVLVNDRADVALAAGCAGVHLPAAALPAAAVRRVVSSAFVVGRSVHDGEEDVAAVERDESCDYLTFGTVYPSASKPGGHRAAGVEALRSACARSTRPVQAIGGITVATADAVAEAGAAGVAAIGLFTDGWSPGESVDRMAAVVGQLRDAFARAGRL